MLARARSSFPAVPAVVALLIAVSAFASPARAAGPSPWVPAPREYYTELAGFRGVADTYFDENGTRYVMPSGGVFERHALGGYVELGWKPRLSFLVGAPAVSMTHRIDDFSANETGLGDILVGFRTPLTKGSTAFAVQADWLAPLGYLANDRSELGAPPDSVPSLGLGRQEFTGWLLAGMRSPFLTGFLQGGAGYRYRERELADQIALTADVGFWVGDWLLAGHYVGAISTGSGETLQDEQTEHVIGPEVRVRVDERLDWFAGARYMTSGKNVPHMDGYYMGMAFKQTGFDRLQGFLGGTRRP